MPYTLSDAMREAFFAPETDKVIVVLLTIDHPDLDNIIRVCLNRDPITSNGNAFLPYPFEIALLPENGESPPVARLRIDAVDLSIVEALRSINDAPTVEIQTVLADTPNTIERRVPPLFWRIVTYNVYTLEGVLEGPAAFNRRAIKDAFTPTVAPALFKSLN